MAWSFRYGEEENIFMTNLNVVSAVSLICNYINVQ
jgi:hypothetical protein